MLLAVIYRQSNRNINAFQSILSDLLMKTESKKSLLDSW